VVWSAPGGPLIALLITFFEHVVTGFCRGGCPLHTLAKQMTNRQDNKIRELGDLGNWVHMLDFANILQVLDYIGMRRWHLHPFGIRASEHSRARSLN
jgi:hypothetical protein